MVGGGATPPDLITRTRARELLATHGLSPKRSLGQNFVVDPGTVRRIARIAGVGPGDQVIEVGAGLGSLTLALAETGADVTAVELDPGLAAVVREVAGPAGVAVVEADARSLDWAALLHDHEWVLVANLPYNIATPLVADLLDTAPQITRMLVMVQREVGERLAAGPGTRAYGAVSVKVAYWATAEVAGRVPAQVFLPRPRVESVLVRIERRARPAVDVAPDALFPLVRTAFGQRRKMLRRSLAGIVTPEQMAAVGVAPESRPEDLGVEEWGALARAVAGRG